MSKSMTVKMARKSNGKKPLHWLMLIVILAVISGIITISQSRSKHADKFVLEYSPAEEVVVAKQSEHVQVELLKPQAIARIAAEPLLAFAFIAGTADPICAAIITAALFVLAGIVIQTHLGRQTVGGVLHAMIASLILSAQAFTVACWLSFYAPTIRYRATKSNCAIANLHAHTYYSSGLFSPAGVVEWHRRRGFNVIAVTDTNTARGGIEAQQYAMAMGYKTIVIAGEELHSGTHLLLLGINHDYSPDEDPERVIQKVRSADGVVIVAHPWTAHHPIDELALHVNGFEVINRNIISDDIPLWQAFHGTLALIASNDFKFGAHSFTATCLHGEIRDANSALKALRSGETLPMTWFKHLPISPEEYELQTLTERFKTIVAAFALYLGFLDIWAVFGWVLFITLGLLISARVLHARKERPQTQRPMLRRMNQHTGWLIFVTRVIGFSCALFGTIWTWSPTTKMALGYYPLAVILLWLIGDLLILWKHSYRSHKRVWIVSKL